MTSKDTPPNVTLLNVTGNNPRINQGSVDQSDNAVQPSAHEGIIQKVLGPTAIEVGKDLRKIYIGGRDRIFSAAHRKIRNPDDGKQANLRVAHGVILNGACTEDEICAEYFGGILAASRSDDGRNDDAIQFVEVIKSMSSKQLRLHYVIYNALSKLLVSSSHSVNVGNGPEIEARQVWFVSLELAALGLQVDTDSNILNRLGLLSQYRYDTDKQDSKALPYLSANPTTFGVLLYAAAHNRFGEWRLYDRVDFGNFDEIVMPTCFAATKQALWQATGLKVSG